MTGPRIKHVSSADNPQYKLLKKLAGSARERRKLGRTLLDGVHLLSALADAGGEPEMIILRAGSEDDAEIAQCVARFPAIEAMVLSGRLFDALSSVVTPTGVLGLLPIPTPARHRHDCAVLLEAIQDPGNLGTILRTAAAAGVDAVYLSKGCAEAWSPKALRAGMGAHFTLALYEHCDLVEVMGEFETVLAAALDASQSIYETDLTGRVGFLFGNEGAGLSREAKGAASLGVRIPMPGRIESLNVAAATAVSLFERVRQLQARGEPRS